MEMRSGRTLAAAFLKNERALAPEQGPPIKTSVSVDNLLHAASDAQDQRFVDDGDDAEGVELCSRPQTPCTDEEASDLEDSATILEIHTNSKAGGREFERLASEPVGQGKRRREEEEASCATSISRKDRIKLAFKKRRSIKRISEARDPHRSSSYAPKASVVEHLKDVPHLEVELDAQRLPKSLEGSWVGKRVTSERDTPWGLDELIADGFTVVKWDGR
jgi:hypothetical protein